MRTAATRIGTVRAFDETRGLGTVEGDDGRTYPFHCIEIADGSRTIDVGVRVEFAPMRKLGALEAADLRPA